MRAIAAQKLVLPTLTPLHLWKSSGRWKEGDTEMMTLFDRHDKEYLLSPTHEEAICELLSHGSGQRLAQLPLLLYQISAKFRDEARPCHALLSSLTSANDAVVSLSRHLQALLIDPVVADAVV
ncbi:Aminoacyl-tRNA synthetase class II (G/ P/ S/T) [Trinorchestia longiramus]|nr:Aminoacyl-tRNA synthetase class II (G/ P/ S/T) [Trinorchestia longiramus]